MESPSSQPTVAFSDVSVSPQAESDGADAPRAVIRGESSPPHPEAAFTDWLNVSFPLPSASDPAQLVFDLFSEATAHAFGAMTDQRKGLHGYSRSFVFDRGAVLFALGGQRNTGFISIPAEGCALVPSWAHLTAVLNQRLGGRITRWDGAVDDFAGMHSVDLAVELWKLGGFSSGGNRPSIDQRGNWLEPDGGGRTFYVGRRKNGKLVRIYEKGKQLGLPSHPWVRWEVELHNIDRHIPWDVLSEPGTYVAGSYPCMAWVSQKTCRIRSIKAQDSLTYERLTQVGSIAYGALINVMLQREGSPERVVERLRRIGVPRRLAGTDRALKQAGGGDEV